VTAAADRIPVEVGQVREDPDQRHTVERGYARTVRVVEVSVPAVFWGEPNAAALVEDETTGRRTRIALRRLERWRVTP
jgi:hypothetical protein